MHLSMPISHYTAQAGFNEFKTSSNSRCGYIFQLLSHFKVWNLKFSQPIAKWWENQIIVLRMPDFQACTLWGRMPFSASPKPKQLIGASTKTWSFLTTRKGHLHCTVMLRNRRVFLKTSSHKWLQQLVFQLFFSLVLEELVLGSVFTFTVTMHVKTTHPQVWSLVLGPKSV